jgi:acetyl-CoA carboxylase biotin carboxyl carrier protein
MDNKEVARLVRLMKSQGVAEFSFRHDGVALEVKFAGAMVAVAAPVTAASPVYAPPSAATPAPVAAVAAAPAADHKSIKASLVGTFYRSSSPDAPAYVNVGDRVRKGQVVCIIEAMKLMNQIESDLDGTITEILVDNAQPVQFGHELFRVRPG